MQAVPADRRCGLSPLIEGAGGPADRTGVHPDAPVDRGRHERVMTDTDLERYISPVTMCADRRYVVTVTGTLDSSTAADLERLAQHGLGPGTDVLVLNLAGVTHCDGMAVETL